MLLLKYVFIIIKNNPIYCRLSVIEFFIIRSFNPLLYIKDKTFIFFFFYYIITSSDIEAVET